MRSSQVRRVNEVLVLDQLRQLGQATRSELAEITSLTPQALGSILAGLRAEGAVILEYGAVGGPGRPPALYRLNPQGSSRLGIAVTSKQVWYCWFDALGAPTHQDGVAIGKEPTAEAVLEAVIEGAMADRPHPEARIELVGVAVEGVVDEVLGSATTSTAWPEEDVPVGAIVAEMTDAPVEVTSRDRADARAAISSVGCGPEQLVAVVEFSNLLTLELSKGGDFVTNRVGRPTQLAHLPVPGLDRPCECGRRGCLATVTSGPAVVAAYSERTGQSVESAAEVLRRVANHDPDAITTIMAATNAVVRTVTPLLRAIGPDVVIVTGAIGGSHSSGIQMVLKDIRQLGDPELAETQICAPDFPHQLGALIGAAYPSGDLWLTSQLVMEASVLEH